MTRSTSGDAADTGGPIERAAIDQPVTGRTVATSAAWRLVESIGGETMALIVFVVMARLLVPEHFGVVALAGVFIAAAQTILHQGLAEPVIRGDELGQARLTAAFWCNLGLGTGLMVFVMGAALPLAQLFAEPQLAPALAALALVLPLSAAGAILQARFQRRMAFKTIALRVLLANSIGGAVGLGLAFAGAGVWALVGLQLTGMATGVLVLVLADPWRPRLALDRAQARQLVRFALPVMGTHLAKFAGKKLDLAVLGLFVSATDLGHYFLATRLIFALGLATHYTVYSLTLPVLARLAAEPDALRSAASRTLWLTTALCLPAGLGLALVADPLVPLLMGAVWQPSVPPLQILAGFSIAYALALVAGQIMVAAGSPGLFLRLTLANTALFLIMVAVAAPWGLAAAALAGSLANVLMLPTHLIAMKRTVGLAPKAVLRDQLPVWLAAGMMALAILAVRAVAAEALGPLPFLALLIVAGLTAYTLALWFLAGTTLRSLAQTMSTDRSPPFHAASGTA